MSEGLYPSRNREEAWPIQSAEVSIRVTHVLTLLVNSKTPWMATLHPTVEGSRDHGCYVKQCSPMLLEMQWPRLNQQSLCWHGLSPLP